MPKHPSVVIIGAGAAGLSAAIRLKQKGYSRVTVLEAADVVGGKCHSLQHNGATYDLGANLTTPRYTQVRALAKTLGLTRRPLSERHVQNLTDRKMPSLKNVGPLKPLLVRGGALYYVLARAPTGIDKLGYLDVTKGVQRPFGDWLKRNGLARFHEVFANLFVSYGYGNMDELPAAYALKFFDQVHLNTSLDVATGKLSETTTDFAEGFQSLWTRAVDHFGIDVKTGVTIEHVRRSPRSASVTWFDKNGVQQNSRWGRLILAMPFQDTLSFLDASQEEKRLFNRIRTNEYFVTAAVAPGMTPNGTYLYPYSSTVTPGQPTVHYQPIPNDPNHVHMFYAYGGKDVDPSTVRARIRTLLQRDDIDGHLNSFLVTKRWKYFPHVSSKDMQAGFYQDFDALQGRFNTWYVGELLSFTLVELVHRHTNALINRSF